MSYDSLPARLSEVRGRIADAATRSGRSADAVTLVAVTKKLGLEACLAAVAAGLEDLGENYLQEGLSKQRALREALIIDPAPLRSSTPQGEARPVRWHMIGRLQSNKAALAARSFSMLHGVDSLSVVRSVASACRDAEPPCASLLLQIKLGGGEQRAGVEPEQAEGFLRQALANPGIRFAGVMAVADPGHPARGQFATLFSHVLRLRSLQLENAPLTQISAGMSGDYEDAVAEGATIVRIGTALFGQR